jgi:hypothetical protein
MQRCSHATARKSRSSLLWAGIPLGFAGHPGVKSAMIEDIIMEFDETPDGTAQTLARLREVQFEVTDSLSSLMVGLVTRLCRLDGPSNIFKNSDDNMFAYA